jgi:hypothetical protein
MDRRLANNLTAQETSRCASEQAGVTFLVLENCSVQLELTELNKWQGVKRQLKPNRIQQVRNGGKRPTRAPARIERVGKG